MKCSIVSGLKWSNQITYLTKLPGQTTSLQVVPWLEEPTQLEPTPFLAGHLHCLALNFVPLPQLLEQSDQADQEHHPPFTSS